ncbi:MAG: ABC transporter C-terminal domain-containing protein, partial [Solirubrobacteraceae bacterium]
GWEDYVREREERRAVEVAASRGDGAGDGGKAAGGAGKPASGKGAKRTAAVKEQGAANCAATREAAHGAAAAGGAKPSKNRQREAGKLERRIEEAEAALARVEDEIAGPEAWSSPQRSADSTARHEEAKRAVAELYEHYGSLAG